MQSCSTMSWKTAWETGLLHKPWPVAAHGPKMTIMGSTGSPSKKLSSRVNSGNKDRTWPSRVPFRLPLMQGLQRDGGSLDSSWLEWSIPGRNPTACLQRAPFHTLAIRLLLALLTGVFIVEEKFTGVGGQRGQSVRWRWREWAFQTLTSPKIVFYATKNQVSLVYTTKCLTLSKSMSKKTKTQSLHWMFIFFTRLVLPPPPSSYFKTVQTGKTL